MNGLMLPACSAVNSFPVKERRVKLSTVLGVMLAALAILLALRLFFSSTLDPLLIQAIGAAVLFALPLLAMRQAGATRLPPRPTRAAAVFAVLIGLLASVVG